MHTDSFRVTGSCATPHPTSSRVRDVNVVIEPMSLNRWRVCDSSRPDNDKRHLLGFIEFTKELEFEVMSLIRGFEWFTYPTLAEANAHFDHPPQPDDRVDSDADAFFDAVSTPVVE